MLPAPEHFMVVECSFHSRHPGTGVHGVGYRPACKTTARVSFVWFLKIAVPRRMSLRNEAEEGKPIKRQAMGATFTLSTPTAKQNFLRQTPSGVVAPVIFSLGQQLGWPYRMATAPKDLQALTTITRRHQAYQVLRVISAQGIGLLLASWLPLIRSISVRRA